MNGAALTASAVALVLAAFVLVLAALGMRGFWVERGVDDRMQRVARVALITSAFLTVLGLVLELTS